MTKSNSDYLNAGTKIKYAVLHDVLFIPGAGQFGPTLTSTPSGTQKGVTMVLTGDMLSISPKKGVTMLLPIHGNIKGMMPE